MKITIIGTGYVGLVTGTCFAEAGNDVVCLDIDEKRIEGLSKGFIPFYEPGLKEIVERNIDQGRICFTTSYKQGCENNIFFICVGTPDDGNGKPDLTNLNLVLRSLKNNIDKDSYIFTKSTVPLGTNKLIQEYFNENSDYDVTVSSNPEFLKEGSAVSDFQKPDRIVVGSSCQKSKKIMEDLFKPFNRRKNKMLHVSVESAELIKYASNSFLATKISFINEMALLCEKTNADINEIRLGMGSDPRIGSAFLYAGLGYGGSCFPKDVNALIDIQKELGLGSKILEKTKEVNENQVTYFADKIYKRLEDNSQDRIISIWGLSFKPNSDDIRESVAIKLIRILSKKFKQINLYDPIANEIAKRELKDLSNLKFCEEKYETLGNSSALVICTEWKEFWDPNLSEFNQMSEAIIFDGRNILNKNSFVDAEVEYHGIGV